MIVLIASSCNHNKQEQEQSRLDSLRNDSIMKAKDKETLENSL